MNPIQYFLFLFPLVYLNSHFNLVNAQNTQKSEITIEAEDFTKSNHFEKTHYYTGKGIKSTYNQQNASISYQIKFPEAGQYYIWLLAAAPEGKPFKANFELTSKAIKPPTSNFQVILKPSTEWLSVASPTGGLIRLDIQNTEEPIFEIKYLGYDAIFLDKLIFTSNHDFQPTGYAFVENTEIVLPPAWAFGLIYGGYTNQLETLERIDKLQKNNFPIDAYWIDSWFWDYQTKGKGPSGYLDFVGDTLAFPEVAALWDKLKSKNIKAGIWIWNVIQKTGNETVFDDFEQKGFFKSTFLNNDSWHNALKNTPTGEIDFSNPESVNYWKSKMKPLFEKGLDFLKLDKSSELDFCQAAFEAIQEMGKETKGRAFILAHLHTTDQADFKKYPTKWTGDAKIAWTQPNYPNLNQYAMGAFSENIEMIANPLKTTYEIPFLTHDAGGYDFFGSEEAEEELYIRWTQFALLNPITTIFSTAKNPTANLPFNYSEQAQAIFRYYAQLKLRLFPYIYTYAHLTRQSNQKMIQGNAKYPHQYLLGNDFLVAPVHQKGADSCKVYLPEGKWFDFYTLQSYQGNQIIEIQVTLDKIPLFVRAGAIIPYRPLANAIEKGHNDTLQLAIYPSEMFSEFTLIEDDGTSNDYQKGKIAQTKIAVQPDRKTIKLSIAATQGLFEGMKPSRYFQINFVSFNEIPKKIWLNGKKLKKSKVKTDKAETWFFDTKKRVLYCNLLHQRVDNQVLDIKK